MNAHQVQLSEEQRQSYFKACLSPTHVYVSEATGYRYECDETVLTAAQREQLVAAQAPKKEAPLTRATGQRVTAAATSVAETQRKNSEEQARIGAELVNAGYTDVLELLGLKPLSPLPRASRAMVPRPALDGIWSDAAGTLGCVLKKAHPISVQSTTEGIALAFPAGYYEETSLNYLVAGILRRSGTGFSGSATVMLLTNGLRSRCGQTVQMFVEPSADGTMLTGTARFARPEGNEQIFCAALREGTREVRLSRTIPSPLQSRPVTAQPRPPLQFAHGPLYLGVGGGHWISENNGSGRIIELEDGSLWEINSVDQVDTALWLAVTDITVLDADEPIADFRYLLVNTEDGEKALAKYLGMK